MKIINTLPSKTDIQEQVGNLNWLYKNIMDKIGSADISSAGDSTITGPIRSLDSIRHRNPALLS